MNPENPIGNVLMNYMRNMVVMKEKELAKK